MESINLTELLSARRDRYAVRQGPFVLRDDITAIGDAVQVWEFVRACEGRTFRVLYVCQDGTTRDMIGRQGVYASEQDGTVQGTGHAMASAQNLTLSFWTYAHGKKVNTGSGKGYRTLRAEGILALRVDGADIVTDAGRFLIRDSFTFVPD